MATITQDTCFRLSLIRYMKKQSISKAALQYRVTCQYIRDENDVTAAGHI